jgi:hypothetical protein
MWWRSNPRARRGAHRTGCNPRGIGGPG